MDSARRSYRRSPPVEDWLPTVINREGCWLWPWHLDLDGYGRTKRDGKYRKVHRVVHELLVGPAPEGLVPDHQCHNAAAAAGQCAGGASCVHRMCARPDPDHVLWVPPGVNAVSGLSLSAINAAKIVGDCGHPFDYVRPDGARGCRRCRTAAVARWRARQR